MDSVFLLNSRHSAHVGFWLRPDLGCFGEEVFKSRRSDIDENADWLIRIIFKTVDRAAGGINAIAREQVGPGTVHKKTNPAFNDIEPFVFAFMVMRPRSAARRRHIEKGCELTVGLFSIEEHHYCVAKCTQRSALVGSDQKSTEQ